MIDRTSSIGPGRKDGLYREVLQYRSNDFEMAQLLACSILHPTKTLFCNHCASVVQIDNSPSLFTWSYSRMASQPKFNSQSHSRPLWFNELRVARPKLPSNLASHQLSLSPRLCHFSLLTCGNSESVKTLFG